MSATVLPTARNGARGDSGGYSWRHGESVVDIVPARSSHGPILANALRDNAIADPQFVNIGLGEQLAEAITRADEAYAGFYNQQLAVVWGIYKSSMVVNESLLWAVTTKVADECPFTFARHSQMAIKRYANGERKVIAYVEKSYKRSHRWVKWLGFHKVKDFEQNGMQYSKYVLRSD